MALTSLPLRSSSLTRRSSQMAMPCPAITASIACSSSRKGQLVELFEEGDRVILGAKTIQPPAPRRRLNGLGRPVPMNHRVVFELMVTGERFAIGQRIRAAQDEKFAPEEFLGGESGGRIPGPMSHSPPCRLSTRSVPMISSETPGCTVRHKGKRGTSHRLAKAFVVETFKERSRGDSRMADSTSANESSPSRMTGKRRAPASVKASGRGRRRKRGRPQ
jgi:hypothetical protein